MDNRFYVQPANILQGLGALQQGIQAGVEAKAAQAKEAQKTARRKQAADLLKANDIDELQAFMIENPDIASEIDNAYQFKNEATKQNAIDTAWDVYTGRKSTSQGLIERAEFVRREGGDITETLAGIEKAQSDPAFGKPEATLFLMRKDPEAFKLYQESKAEPEQTAGQKEFESLTKELSPKEKLKAKRISLGLDPRAVGSAVQTITKEGNVKEIAQTEATIAGVKEGAKLGAQLKLRPEIESAVTRAVSIANEISADRTTAKSNEKAMTLYETSMRGLISGMSGTDTGPFIGMTPALTARAQIAEGAVAAMAPVLKQLFRSAGEGVFTDKDQELLLQMIPTRKDRPEARAAKLQNIDAIVRAKLGQTAAPAAEPVGALPEGVSEEDITETMRANNMTREQVLTRLRGQ